MKLYDYLPSGNGYKIRLILAHRGLRYDYVPVDIMSGETRTAGFLARNPNGRIPVLELDDGTILCESNAILYYLAQGSALWPVGLLDQAHVMQWLFFEQYSHEPNIATARFWLGWLKPEPTPYFVEALARKQEAGRAALQVMETHLETRPFFVGDRCTIADIALYAYTHVAPEGGFDLSPYPGVRAWLERVRGQPGHVELTQYPTRCDTPASRFAAMKLDHVTILVSSLEHSMPFYDRLLSLLGFEKQRDHVWSDGAGFYLQFQQAAAGTRPYERYGPGMNHLGFGAASQEQVVELRAAMLAAGFEVPAIQHLDGATALFMKDPDGIRFEVTHYPPGESVID